MALREAIDLHIPYMNNAEYVNGFAYEHDADMMAIQRWMRRWRPLNAIRAADRPMNEWPWIQNENMKAVERWALNQGYTGTCLLHIPYKTIQPYDPKLNWKHAENMKVIQRWAYRFVRNCLYSCQGSFVYEEDLLWGDASHSSPAHADFGVHPAGTLLLVFGWGSIAYSTLTSGWTGFDVPGSENMPNDWGQRGRRAFIWWKIADGTETTVSANTQGPNGNAAGWSTVFIGLHANNMGFDDIGGYMDFEWITNPGDVAGYDTTMTLDAYAPLTTESEALSTATMVLACGGFDCETTSPQLAQIIGSGNYPTGSVSWSPDVSLFYEETDCDTSIFGPYDFNSPIGVLGCIKMHVNSTLA